MVQDFYQLSKPPIDADTWDVMSFNAYDGSELAIFAFSGRNDDQQTVKLKGLQKDKIFTIKSCLDKQSDTMSGQELMTKGIDMKLSANGANLWIVK